MSFPVHCPSCGRSGRVPDHCEGQRIRCPRCRHTFRATEAIEEMAAALLCGDGEAAAGSASGYGDDMLL